MDELYTVVWNIYYRDLVDNKNQTQLSVIIDAIDTDLEGCNSYIEYYQVVNDQRNIEIIQHNTTLNNIQSAYDKIIIIDGVEEPSVRIIDNINSDNVVPNHNYQMEVHYTIQPGEISEMAAIIFSMSKLSLQSKITVQATANNDVKLVVIYANRELYEYFNNNTNLPLYIQEKTVYCTYNHITGSYGGLNIINSKTIVSPEIAIASFMDNVRCNTLAISS